MKLLPLLLASCTLTAAVPASAYEWKARFTDGPAVGWLTGGDLREDILAYGWQGGFDVSPLLSLELAYTYWEDDLRSGDLAALGLPSGAKLNLDNHSLALSARLHFLQRETWSAYAGGGVSYFIANEEDQRINEALAAQGGSLVGTDIEVNSDFALHALAGAEYSLSRHWEIFGEARVVFADYDLDARLISRDGNGQLFSSDLSQAFPYDHTLLRVGVNYRF